MSRILEEIQRANLELEARCNELMAEIHQLRERPLIVYADIITWLEDRAIETHANRSHNRSHADLRAAGREKAYQEAAAHCRVLAAKVTT